MGTKRTNLQERYELRAVLGRGGMGVVYRAFDTLMKREVALKTILDVDNPAAAELFYKEWSILATMVHPNVIQIYDIGEFEEEGIKKPFFVMPLLPGVALDRLIREGSPRLSVKNAINIVEQASRGLQAAHEQGLIHRDVKPSNIFVMDDDSVKIIDFGIARVAATSSKTSVKGTLFYLAPEFLEMKPPSPLSDQFALAVTAYEALTRRRPFDGATESEVFEAIRKYTPPPVAEVNSNVSFALSQVLHKALAKQPYHRFPSIREFGEALQKARRNEPLELFDSAKVKPRLEKARASFEDGDYAFASELLAELEAEGCIDQEIGLLRRQVDQAVRQGRIRQSLQSARRFFEASEHTLALRKIQDALDLDDEDADALAMKAQVERDRREKKIEEWVQLGRQHLEHQAFGQAREALDNALKIRPNDTGALELVAEVARREREISQVREEKGRLYQAAMHAWDKGDVTAALGKLEVLMKLDRDMPESDAGRTGTYQKFFNQVQSEHSAIKNAYDEARQKLSNDDFEGALAICRQYLTRYPGHALFQALKFDVEERQRQNLSSIIAETDRRVEEEPDMDRRAGILEEALRQYPGEPHFERAMKLVRDKRDLVNSIVAKARFYEDRGQFPEALDQWQILRSIHERQPGLSFEIERLEKKRDQQTRESSKARWVDQIDRYLEAGDYDRALRTVESALAEFPGEPELVELNKVARKASARAAEAQEWLSKGRELAEKGEAEESLAPLRQALELHHGNTVIRTVLINSLLEHARRLIQGADFRGAEAGLKEALALEPQHAAARSLLNQIEDHRREDYVSACLTQARRLQADGDLTGALAIVTQGIQAYPNEPRFEQLQASLQRTHTEARRHQVSREARQPKAAPADADELTAPISPPPQPPPLPQTAALSAETAELPAPAVVPPLPAQTAVPPPPHAAAPAAHTVAPPLPQAAPPQAQTAPSPFAAPPPLPGPAAAPRPAGPAHAAKKPVSRSKDLLVAGIGMTAMVIVITGGIAFMKSRQKPPAPPATYKIAIHASPEGAAIAVDGQPCGTTACEAQLAAGEHRAEATLAGYQNAVESFSVVAGGATEVRLRLDPPPAAIAISTDLTDGTLSLDGAQVAQIQGGEVELPSLAPGSHTLQLQSSAAQASLTLEFPAGALPRVSAIQAQGVKAVVLARRGSLATVYSSAENIAATLDGKPAGTAGPAGLQLKDLAPGSHQLQLSISGLARKIPFDAAQAPGVIASLLTDRNVGAVRIVTGADDAAVYVDGQKYRRNTVRGRLLLYLAPRKYQVRVEKAGLWAPEQTVEVKRGEEIRLDFQMAPAVASLEIRQAPPSADVLLDGNHIGSTRADGTFAQSNIAPGKHTVSVRKESYRTFQTEVALEPGKAAAVSAEMSNLPGTLKIDVSPDGIQGMQVRLVREGESQERTVSETELPLPEGTYKVTASAPQYADAGVTVKVTAGRQATAALVLKRPGASARAAKTLFATEDWEKAGWKRDGKLVSRRGGEFSLLPANLGPGTCVFTAFIMRGKRLEWVANYRDDRNYSLFQIDDKNFNRSDVINGRKVDTVKLPHSLSTESYISVTMRLTGDSIVHSLLAQQQWRVVDQWTRPGGGVQGRIGFFIPGRDEITLSDFRFTTN